MSEQSSDTLLTFPCEFPLKAMGAEPERFASVVLDIVQRHIGEHVTEQDLTQRPSKNGTYLAVTVTFEAHSKQQIDDLYRELHAHPLVKYLL